MPATVLPIFTVDYEKNIIMMNAKNRERSRHRTVSISGRYRIHGSSWIKNRIDQSKSCTGRQKQAQGRVGIFPESVFLCIYIFLSDRSNVKLPLIKFVDTIHPCTHIVKSASVMVSAAIASTTTTARGTITGSCRPLISSSRFSPVLVTVD